MTWFKYILEIEDWNIINTKIIFLDLEKSSKDLIELILKLSWINRWILFKGKIDILSIYKIFRFPYK